MIYKFKIKSLLLALILFFVFFASGKMVSALENKNVSGISKVYLEGPSAVAQGSEIKLSVLLDALDPINALDLEISYPIDKLKFLGFDNTHSIVDIWQSSPGELQSGNIKLTGGIFKSFKGAGGLVIKLSFISKAQQQIKISFKKSDIYKADGKGTKIEMLGETYNFSVLKNTVKLDNPGLKVAIPLPPDNTPPVILFDRTLSPADNSTLLVWNATDPESGIRQTDMRIKKWWSFDDWQTVQNPVLYPKGAWTVELRAINNAGEESVKKLSLPSELVKKILTLLGGVIILVFIIIRMYNPAVKFCKNFTAGYNNRKRKI